MSGVHEVQHNVHFQRRDAYLQSKCFAVALLVGSVALFGIAAYGGIGVFASSTTLPQGLAHALGTIGHTGCVAMLVGGIVLGGLAGIHGSVLLVKALNRGEPPTSDSPDIDPREGGTCTSLSAAVSAGSIEDVIAFLDEDADIEARDDSGKTPLLLAASSGQAEVVSLLLNSRNQVNEGVHERDNRSFHGSILR